MGSTLVARRVTGTLSGNPYAGTEWLHRNHLQEVVGADYSNMSGCTNCSWSWAYGEPFGSGGSDQFAGHKDDPETGMKYFGARYYHATSARWISADSLTARVYDPQSLNKYAYVRNDPVNLVDRLGQWYECAYYSEGQCQWYYFDPTPHIQFWLLDGQGPYEGSGGGGGDIQVALDQTPITHTVSGLSISDANAQRLYSIASSLVNLLKGSDPDAVRCASVLDMLAPDGTVVYTAADLLREKITTKRLAVGQITSPAGTFTHALVSGAGVQGVPSNIDIVVNVNGAAFSSAVSLGVRGIEPGSNAALGLVVLHELGHLTWRLRDDGPSVPNSTRVSISNTRSVHAACAGILSRL